MTLLLIRRVELHRERQRVGCVCLVLLGPRMVMCLPLLSSLVVTEDVPFLWLCVPVPQD